MTEFLGALARHDFLWQAWTAGLLASLGCGLVGPFVVVKRITFLAGGIAHSVLAGMGAGVYFGFDPLLGALIAAVVAALLIGWVRLYSNTREDTTIGALWAIGMAVGILFIAETPGYTSDLMSFLFGNILLVPKRELWFMALLDGVLLVSLTLFHRQFVALAFDEEFARLRGVPVGPLYLALLVLVAITVVLMIQVVGLILVIALLTLPAAIAGLWTRSLAMMMLLAILIGALLTSGGLALSYAPDWPVGPTIIVLAGSAYLAALLARRSWQAWRRVLALLCLLSVGLPLGCGERAAEPEGPPADELSWDDLLPADWQPEKLLEDLNVEVIADEDPRASDVMARIAALWKEAPVVSELDGRQVRLPGFVVPIDLEADHIARFLLVPYFGACIHVPPPPANQTVYVQTRENKPYVGGLFDTVWVEGQMHVDDVDSAQGNAGYRIDQARVTPYEIKE